MKTVSDVIGLARSNLAERAKNREPRPVGRPPQPDEALVAEITAVIADLPTYGYRRVHAILRRRAMAEGRQPPNHKRVYGAMKRNGLLLQRHAGRAERRHDGRVSVDEPNLRWCSDGFEVSCDNGEKVRIAFALDCCDREAMSFVATTGGIGGDEVRDLMVAAVEHRFGRIDRLPDTIEWLSDNGSGYIAHETRSFARGLGLEPRTTPVESPQSNGMAEAFVRTIKRDYARVSSLPDAEPSSGSFLAGLPTTTRFTRTERSATVHPASSSRLAPSRDRVRSFGGNNTPAEDHMPLLAWHLRIKVAGIAERAQHAVYGVHVVPDLAQPVTNSDRFVEQVRSLGQQARDRQLERRSLGTADGVGHPYILRQRLSLAHRDCGELAT